MVASTVTVTPDSVIYDALAATSTDQVAGLSSEEVALRVVSPTLTVTVTPVTAPVSPLILNPAAFSAMLMMLSVAMASTFSTRAPAACMVRSNVAVASL